MAPQRRARSVVVKTGGRGGDGPDSDLIQEHKRLQEKYRTLQKKWKRDKRKREELQEQFNSRLEALEGLVRRMTETGASAVLKEESGDDETEEVDVVGVDDPQESEEKDDGEDFEEVEVATSSVNEMEEAISSEEEREEAIFSEEEREEEISSEEEMDEAISSEDEREEAISSEDDREEAISSEEEMDEAISSEDEREEAAPSQEEREEEISSEEEMEEAISSEDEIEEPVSSSSSHSTPRSSQRRANLLHSSIPLNISPDGSKGDLIKVAKSNRRKSTKKPRPLKIHAVDNSKPEGFFCLCSLQFENQGRLTEHVKYFNADPKFKCDYCSLRFLQLSVLKKHMWTAHKQRFPSGTIGCGDCGEVFKIRELHKAHRLRFHAKENEDLHKSHAMDKKAGRNVWKCTCGKIFAKKQYLLNHVRHYTNNVDWTCKICGRIFKTLGSLRSHGRNVHKTDFFPENTVGCNHCGDIFPSRKPLQEHTHRIHGIITWRQPEGPSMIRPGRFHGFPESSPQSGGSSEEERLIRCLCGSGFPTKRELVAHIGQNRPHVPFKCPVCAVQFSNHAKLKKHMRNLHDRNYNGHGCTFCGTVYADRVTLRRHRDSEHKQNK